MVARCIAVSLHDVAPSTWAECELLLKLTDVWRIPVSLLVVPDYHRRGTVSSNPAFAAAVRARVAQGDQAVLHGYAHLDESAPPTGLRDRWQRRVLTAGEGEMSALEPAAATERLAAGIAELRAADIEPAGFVPPAWLMGPGTRQALRTCGLPYTSTRDELFSLPAFRAFAAPSLVYSSRSAWRRTISGFWNERRRLALRNEPLVRIALHPIDARYPTVFRYWRRILATLLANRAPVLESRWLAARARD